MRMTKMMHMCDSLIVCSWGTHGQQPSTIVLMLYAEGAVCQAGRDEEEEEEDGEENGNVFDNC